ncbi:arsenite efflux transporter (ArsB), putative [Trichophyton verrucosum HKI 0517]|uniref:Arsenite efflux transporter (ArsB), putative n=1 Tax=Trichophyton verrucosum (strain HKI 0517) TaxID=663202 RepID=D4DH45_TRIVH|nr:arsenite efflux transporter (ArsB), putative [Trichophyton verrucosum HKI 0517]EFE38826.1 arsenite efflux transporter (ArsB), putative [Trichophyton verrucosum HKI 0517]
MSASAAEPEMGECQGGAPGQMEDIEKLPQDSPSAGREEPTSIFRNLGILDRYLALWIFLAMAIGIILGNFVDNIGRSLQKGALVGVSVPILRFESLHQVFRTREIWIQMAFSIFINWIIAPFLMCVCLLTALAQVLIWTGLAGGDNEYCAILVAINSLLQMVLFAPLALLFIKIISHSEGTIPLSYPVVAKSVAVFLGIPLGAAIVTRFTLRKTAGPVWYDNTFIKWLSPWSLIGLLFIILALFASQGKQVVDQIVSVVRVAAPLLVYFVIVFFSTLYITYRLGFGYRLSTTQSFTAASNNFELAIAVAIATFGADSSQALASTVGPLIEVPVLLGLVYVARFVAKRVNWKP